MDLMAFIPNYGMKPETEELPNLEHRCEVPMDGTKLKGSKKEKRLLPKLRRWFQGVRLVSRKHPLTRWSLKSTTAVNYEINRHLKSYPSMIHPFSNFRIFWESLITIFTIMVLLTTPYYLTFYFYEHEEWHVLNNVIDFVFILDIVLWFLTGYYDDRTKVIVLDPKIVARKYLKSFFIMDVLPVLPLDYFQDLAPDWMWYITILNMLKILRLRTVIIYWNRLRYVFQVGFQLNKLLEITLVIIMSVHWAACLEYYVPLIVAKIIHDSKDSWLASEYMANKTTRLSKYLTCLNRATTALVCSQHYLSMKAPEDIVLNFFLTLIGFLGFIYLLAEISQLMTSFQSTSKRHLKLIQQLRDYMRYKELPQASQQRLLIFYSYRHKKGFDRNNQILNQVSPYLREELILHTYVRVISAVEMFNHLPQSVIVKLTTYLRTEIFMLGDVIVQAGTMGEALYFIGSGTAAVYTTVGKEVCHLEDGAYFGEISLVMESEYRIANVIAVETSEIYVLSRADFQRAIAPHPELLSRLQNIVLENLDRTLLLDEAYIMEGSVSPMHINISTLKGRRRD